MKIGIITNTEKVIPTLYALASQRLQVSVFFSPGGDPYSNQQLSGFLNVQKIPTREEKNPSKDLYKWIDESNFNVCFIFGYRYLVNLNKLRHAQMPFFNIHFGPLPAFRGPIPVFWQLKAGKATLGLTIHQLSSKFDDGPVAWTKEIPNLPHYNTEIVSQIFAQLAIEGVVAILRCLISGLPVPKLAKEGLSAYQKKPTLKDVSINWEKMAAVEICNLVSACNPWNKGAIAGSLNGQELKLLDARISDNAFGGNSPIQPGEIIQTGNTLDIVCADKKIISVNTILLSNFFVPAYHCPQLGIQTGKKIS